MSSRRRELAKKQYVELDAPSPANATAGSSGGGGSTTVALTQTPPLAAAPAAVTIELSASSSSSAGAKKAAAAAGGGDGALSLAPVRQTSDGAASDATADSVLVTSADPTVRVALPSDGAKDPAYDDATGAAAGGGGGGGESKGNGLPPRPNWSFDITLSSKFIFLSSRLNVLLCTCPFAYMTYYGGMSDGATFLLSMLGMIPLAALLGNITEELAKHTSQTVGGLLNATFGNATEMIISLIALYKGDIRLVQVSLLGSVLSNLLLVMGSAFILGGISKKEQNFNKLLTTTNSGLLMLGVMGMLFPAVLNLSGADRSDTSELAYSRGTALLLLVLYVAYLYFQLKSHSHFFQDDDEEEDKELTVLEGLVWLGIVTVIISMMSDFLVDSIRGTAEDWGISQIFIGVILVPIVGNAAEHWTALSAAYKSKMDLALGVAIGSSTQICIFVVPLMVVLGWMMGQPMSLYFQSFETVTVFSSAILCNFVQSEGRSTWLTGLMLVMAYLLVAGGFLAHADTV